MLPYQLPRGLLLSLSRARPVSRLKVHSTSLAENSQPSCHWTPWRSLKVSSVLSSFQLHDSARSGRIDLSLFCGTLGSNTTRLLNIGMNGTTVEAVTSSRIEVLGGLSRWNMRRIPPRVGVCASVASLQHRRAAAMTAATAMLRLLRIFMPGIGGPPSPVSADARNVCLLPIVSFQHTRLKST